MDLNPTSDSRIFETNWFTDPDQPLIEHKVYYAKSDSVLYYITAHRGPTMDNIEASADGVRSVMLRDSEGRSDDALAQFNKLVKYLNTPVQ